MAKLTSEPACGAGIQIAEKVNALEMSDEKQWEAIDKLQNRLPVWATLLISLLTFITGSTMTYAALAVKIHGGP